jgi:hypothetical protein
MALYQPGQSGNLNGRPKGARNKRTEEIFSRLEERGDKDPADLLSEIVSDEKESKELRVQAANFLLPYKYGKCGSIPAARYISEPVQLPKAVTLDQANSNIALISEMKAQGQIDLDFAESLIADNRTIANNLIAAEDQTKTRTPPRWRSPHRHHRRPPTTPRHQRLHARPPRPQNEINGTAIEALPHDAHADVQAEEPSSSDHPQE